uniref:Putative lipocalin n=1 Tax=Ixodes ricinus TaxID=34613 RepID=V5H5I8_IXORI
MGLLYAALFACIATTCAWQAQMTIRNPENNPLLNDPKYGPLQSAWKDEFRIPSQSVKSKRLRVRKCNTCRLRREAPQVTYPYTFGEQTCNIQYGDYS